MDNLLKQAMADAKQVRDTAVANARLMLENEFEPRFKKMISEGLQKEAINPGSSGIAGSSVTVKDPGPKEPSAASNDSSGANGSGSEVKAFGEGPVVEGDMSHVDDPNLDGDMGLHGDDASMDVGPDAAGGVDVNLDMDPSAGMDGMDDLGGHGEPGGAHGEFGGHGEQGDEFGGRGDDELDLEAIIRELELDTQDPNSPNSGESHDGYGNDEGGRDYFPKTEGFDDAMCGAKVDGPNTTRRNETVDNGTPNGKEVKPGQALSDDPNSKESHGKGAEAHDGFGKNDGGKDVKPGQSVTEELDLDEILRKIEADDSSSMDESEKIAAENATLKAELKEHRSVVRFLRTELQEVHQMNTKLLYANKLFKAFDLTGAQKMRVVEHLDRASTIREVKITYTVLAEGFINTRRGGKKNIGSLTEGMSGKVVGSTRPKTDTMLNEAAADAAKVARWQKIAGIQVLKG